MSLMRCSVACLGLIVLFVGARLGPSALAGPALTAAPASNMQVNVSSPPVTDQHNASVALSETTAGEVYCVYNYFPAIGPAPSLVSWAFSPAGGAAGSWVDVVKPPDVALGYTEEWNAWISALIPPAGGYVMVSSQRSGPPWIAPTNGIVAHVSPGGGAAFNPGVLLFAAVPGVSWNDYPVVEVDDNPASPTPGAVHFIWTEYFDATGGDSDGNGNPFDDAGDLWSLFTATSNIGGAGGPVFPATTLPIPIVANFPMWANAVASPRGALDILDAGNPLLGPGAVYVAVRDAPAGTILVDANPAPGLGGTWGILTGGTGPIVAQAGIPPILPVIGPGIKADNHVTIATQPAGPCPGAVFLAWDQPGMSDIDIMFSASFNGGITWTTPVRVNQDPLGNGLDQWSPHMRIDATTGEIVIAYLDRRNDPAGNALIEIWSSRSPDCGVTWIDCMVSRVGPTPPVSNVPFPLAPSIGDYLGTDFNLMSGHAYVWNDGRNGVDQDIFFETFTLCDSDADGTPDSLDNCPATPNPAQADSDGDGAGDLCDICPGFNDFADFDTDGVPDGCDNCPTVANASQTDSDGDSAGDACDVCPGFNDFADVDTDGVPDGCDNCLAVGNPGQIDSDSDGNGDACDICPGFDDFSDIDGDAFPDSCDNCPSAFNPSQADSNSNGIGDACEGTSCCIGVKGNVDCDAAQNVNLTDLTTLVNSLFVTFAPLCCPDEADIDGNGSVNLTDLTLLVNALFVTFTPLPPC